MFSDAKSELQDAAGVVIIRELLKKRCISEDSYYGLIDVDTGMKLLETNMFAFHVNSGEISFRSTVMKRFC